MEVAKYRIPAWLADFYKSQLDAWPVAFKNCSALQNISKKYFKASGLEGYMQFNPARAVSTLAKTDSKSILDRKCFLCSANRPKEQLAFEILPDWELLVNPFPILSYHFTICSKYHIPQKLDIETGFKLASKLPGMAVFFNDDGAGASAPDHLHFQAVPQVTLPLINKIEDSKYRDLNLPFKIVSDLLQIKDLQEKNIPMNVFFWKTKSVEEEIKIVAIPRKSHRPRQYFLAPPARRAVSPGAIDMAGIIVTPIKEDFEALTSEDILDIYTQTGY